MKIQFNTARNIHVEESKNQYFTSQIINDRKGFQSHTAIKSDYLKAKSQCTNLWKWNH